MGLNISQSGFRVLFVCAFLICSSLGANDASNNDRPIVNETIPVRIQITPPGTPEELRPNLVGLANMAIFYLPSSFNFDHVMKATREIVDGVRYALIVNTKDAEKNEVICAIEILEKPWITTEWGDKLRILKYSNCTSESSEPTPFNPDKYEGNTLFNRSNIELTHGDLADLEGQVLPKKKHKVNPPTEHEENIGLDQAGNSQMKTSVLKGIESQILPMDKSASSDKKETETADANRKDFSEGSLAFLDEIFPMPSSTTEKTPCSSTPSQIVQEIESTTKISEEKVNSKDISDDSKALLDSMFLSNGQKVQPQRPQTEGIVESEHKEAKIAPPNNVPADRDGANNQPEENKSPQRDISDESKAILENMFMSSVATDEPMRSSTSTETSIPEVQVISKDFSDDTKALLESIFMSGGKNEEHLSPKTPDNTDSENKLVGMPSPNNNPGAGEEPDSNQVPQHDISDGSKALLESMFASNVDSVVVSPQLYEIMQTGQTTSPSENNDIIKQSVESASEKQENKSNDNETTKRRKRHNEAHIKRIAQEALDQLNENYMRTSILLEVLDYTYANISNDETYYIMSVRLLDENLGEGRVNSELCMMNSKSTKLCSFEVAVNNQNSHLAQSQCAVEASKPGLVGGASRIPESEYDEINEMVADALTNLKGEAGSSYEKTVKIYCASRQVVAGSLYKIVAQFQGADNEKVDCVMEIWSRPWIKQDGTEVKLKCDEKPVMKTRYRRSASDCFLPLLRRAARNAAVPLINRNEFQHIEELINDSVPHAEIEKSLGKPLYKKISTIYCATELYVNDNKHYQINGEFELQNDIFEDCVLTLVDSISGPDVVTLKCDSSPEYRYEYYPSILSIPHNKKTKEQKLFVKFLKKHNRSYGHTSEELNRYEIFVNNLHKIKLLNEMEEGTAKYGLTEFADLTSEEYSKRMGLLYNSEEYESNNIKNPLAKIPDIKLPKEFDWRDKGAVTKVKNQGNCGSCWAFSVTGNIEGLHALKSGKLEEYSEQELLDCDTVDKACSGGLPDNAYKAIEKIGGLELEDEYPYEAHKNKCSFNKTLSHVQVKGAVDLPKNETAMALWLIANGPISIGINANGMQFYRGGISHPWRPLCRHSSLDHGVLIVGFGIAEYPVFNKTLPYWIVKNSWGTGWGERGYYRVFRGDNTCGVSEMASSAVLSD